MYKVDTVLIRWNVMHNRWFTQFCWISTTCNSFSQFSKASLVRVQEKKVSKYSLGIHFCRVKDWKHACIIHAMQAHAKSTDTTSQQIQHLRRDIILKETADEMENFIFLYHVRINWIQKQLTENLLWQTVLET